MPSSTRSRRRKPQPSRSRCEVRRRWRRPPRPRGRPRAAPAVAQASTQRGRRRSSRRRRAARWPAPTPRRARRRGRRRAWTPSARPSSAGRWRAPSARRPSCDQRRDHRVLGRRRPGRAARRPRPPAPGAGRERQQAGVVQQRDRADHQHRGEVAGDRDPAGADPVDDRSAEHLDQHQRQHLGERDQAGLRRRCRSWSARSNGSATIETRVPVQRERLGGQPAVERACSRLAPATSAEHARAAGTR